MLFGSSWLHRARINRLSGNRGTEFVDVRSPGLRDFPAVSGFQLYDTSTRTVITDTSFANFPYLPDMGANRPCALLTMTHSDVYKPSAMSYTARLSYPGTDKNAILNVVKRDTGSSWMFNWIGAVLKLYTFCQHHGKLLQQKTHRVLQCPPQAISRCQITTMHSQPDTDGTGAQWFDSSGAPIPAIVGSYVSWWAINRDCWYQEAWGSWVCKHWPGQDVARLDIRVLDDGGQTPYTEGLDARRRGEIAASDPSWRMGYVGQLGFRGSTQRMMPLTRNEGTVGVTGVVLVFFTNN